MWKNEKDTSLELFKEENKYEPLHLPKLEIPGELDFAFVGIVIVVGGLAWLLHLEGLTDEMWHTLFWLRWIPAGIITVRILIPVIKKASEWTEIH